MNRGEEKVRVHMNEAQHSQFNLVEWFQVVYHSQVNNKQCFSDVSGKLIGWLHRLRAVSPLLKNPRGTTQGRTKHKRGKNRKRVRAWYAKPRATRATDGSRFSPLACHTHAALVRSQSHFVCVLPHGFPSEKETDRSLLRTSRSTMFSCSCAVEET